MIYAATTRTRVIDHVIGGVRPTGMFFGPGKVAVCGRHLRGWLQPIMNYDREKSYGWEDCPFCKGGDLYGQFHKHRSIKKWWFRLEMLAAQMYADRHPIEPYWDSYEGFGEEQVTKLIEGGEEGRFEVIDGLYEGVFDCTWEEEKCVLQNAIDQLDLEMEPLELREWVDVPIHIDLERMAGYTKAYLTLDLPVEHDHYWREYEDVEEELEFFGINPADLREYYPEIEWSDIQGRTPLIKVKGLVEGWVNCFYTGYWYVMMDAGETLEMIIKGELKEKMILKAGADIIIHDYLNGASSMNAYTIADLQVETKTLYNDGANRYGIQSCCGMVDDAWNGVLAQV